MAFFEPGKRSRCIFTPQLWCEPFDEIYRDEDATFKFLSYIRPQNVVLISPKSEDENQDENAFHENRAYQPIKDAWGDRQVGFFSTSVTEEAWTAPQPCEACTLARRGQVVVVDSSTPHERLDIFLELALASRDGIQAVLEFAPTASLVRKKVILIHSGNENPISEYKRHVVDYINYGNAHGDPDLYVLYKEMLTLALSSDLFKEEEMVLVWEELDVKGEQSAPTPTPSTQPPQDQEAEALDLLDGDSGTPPDDEVWDLTHLAPEPNSKESPAIPAPPPAPLPAPQATKQNEPEQDGDLILRFIDEEVVESEPEKTAAGQEPKKSGEQVLRDIAHKLKEFGIEESLLELAKQEEYRPLSEAEELINKGDYQEALHKLYAVEKFEPAGWEDYRGYLMWKIFQKLTPKQIVTGYFEISDPTARPLVTLKWTNNNIDAILEIKDTSLINLLGTDHVPLRLYETLSVEQVEGWYKELTARPQRERAVIFISVNEIEIPVGLRIGGYANPNHEQTVHFIEIRLEEIKRALIERKTPIEWIKGRIKDHYNLGGNLYEVGIDRVILDDENFFGRRQLINTIIDNIKYGDSFIIKGLRRIGKTSLIKKIQRINNLNDYLLIDVNIQEDAIENLHSLHRAFATKLKKTVEKKYPTAKYPRDAHPKLSFDALPLFKLSNDSTVKFMKRDFDNSMGQILSGLANTPEIKFERLVLLIDEVERLLPDKRTEREGIDGYRIFLRQIRSLTEKHRNFMIGFSGVGPIIREELDDFDSPIYKQYKELPLGMLEQEECRELVDTIGKRMQVYYSPESYEKIFRMTGGHPLITKYLCGSIFRNRGRTSQLVMPEDVEHGINRYFQTSNAMKPLESTYEPMHRYFADEATLLRLIATNLQPDEWIDIKKIEELSNFDRMKLQKVLHNLHDYGWIHWESKNATKCSIRIGLLHRWLRKYILGLDEA